jgi:alginate O-acetyltransferase complex protein AlgI
LVVERWLRQWSDTPFGVWASSGPGQVVRLVLVFHIVCLSWVLFRAASFETVVVYLTETPASDATLQIAPFTLGLVVLGLVLNAVPRQMAGRLAGYAGSWPNWTWAVAAGAGIATIDAMGPDGVAPFIYFQF